MDIHTTALEALDPASLGNMTEFDLVELIEAYWPIVCNDDLQPVTSGLGEDQLRRIVSDMIERHGHRLCDWSSQ